MSPLDSTPILSTREDAHTDEEFGAFLLGLGDAVDWLQDAELRGDLEEVAKRCSALAKDGVRFGLPPLCDASEVVRVACRRGDHEAVRDALVALTEVARRVRLASTAH